MNEYKCAFCGKKLKHELKCEICGKIVCNDCASHMTVYVTEGNMRVMKTRRVCPDCKITYKME